MFILDLFKLKKILCPFSIYFSDLINYNLLEHKLITTKKKIKYLNGKYSVLVYRNQIFSKDDFRYSLKFTVTMYSL